MALEKWLATALIFTALLAVSFADDSNQGVQDINSGAGDFNSILPDINSAGTDFNSDSSIDINAGLNPDANEDNDSQGAAPDFNAGGDEAVPVPDLNLPQGEGEVIADSNGIIEDINEFVDGIIEKVKEIIDPIVEDVGETITGIVIRQSVVNIEGKSARCIGVRCHDMAYETGGTLDDLIVIPVGGSIVDRDDLENPDFNSEMPDLNLGTPIDANSGIDMNGLDANENVDLNLGNAPEIPDFNTGEDSNSGLQPEENPQDFNSGDVPDANSGNPDSNADSDAISENA